MGYGLTFVAFQSSFLKIESIKDNLKSSRTYHNLYKFVYEKSEPPLSEEEKEKTTHEHFEQPNSTIITVIFPQVFPDESIEQSLFATFRIAQHPDVFEAVLRTRSVVGTLDPIFDSQKQSFQFDLKVNGNFCKIIKTEYLTIKEVVADHLSFGESNIFDREKYEKEKIQNTEQLALDAQNLARGYLVLEEKIDNITIGSKPPLEMRLLIYATDISNIQLYNQKIEEEIYSPNFRLEQGIWLAILGMPLGIRLDEFNDVYFRLYTVIVDLKNEQARKYLDAGRKGITDYRKNQIVDRVKDILKKNNFIKYRRHCLGSHGSGISDPYYDHQEKINAKMKNKNKYNDIPITQQYFPLIEEQEVISLFVELVARKILKGYFLKFLSSNQVYDAQYEYFLNTDDKDIQYSLDNNLRKLGIHESILRGNDSFRRDVLVEFKQDLRRLFRDVSNNKKDISHINILVCWSVNFEDQQSLEQETGYVLRERILHQNIYHGVTHELICAGRQRPLSIIELKRVLELAYGFKEKT